MVANETPRHQLHPAVWLCWATAATLTVTVASNPTTSLLVILVAVLTTRALGRAPFDRLVWIMFLLALAFGLLRVALLTLTSHGVGSVWFTLPSVHTPTWLGDFDFGGTIESVVIFQAANEVLVPISLLMVFASFNAVVDHDDLISLIPRSLARPAIVATLALRLMPTFATSFSDASHAAHARSGGHHVRRRDLAVPVLRRTMWQSVAIGESMELRGYPAQMPKISGLWITPLAITLAAALLLQGLAQNAAIWVVAGFVIALAALMWSHVRSRSNPKYRDVTVRLTPRDAVFGLLFIGAATLALWSTRNGEARWMIQEPLSWPTVHLWSGIAAAIFAIPALAKTDTA